MSKRAQASSSPQPESAGRFGAGCGILFGLAFAGFGAAFIVVIATAFSREVKPYLWDKVPCQVQECDIDIDESRGNPFQLRVRYAYAFAGRAFTSDRYALGEFRGSEYEPLALERERLLAGREEVFCRVDPDDPASAVIKPGKLWFLLLAVVPLLFVLVGIGLVVASVSWVRQAGPTPARARSATFTPGKKAGGCGLAVFGMIFLAAGGGVFVPLFVMPLARSLEARDWSPSGCTILWSKIRSQESDDGTSYRADVFYEYEWNGAVHRSNRVSVGPLWSSGGREAGQVIADRYPAGSRRVCYVNPELPLQAVLERERSGLWIGLLPLLFVLAGGGVSWTGFRLWRESGREPPAPSLAGRDSRRPPRRAGAAPPRGKVLPGGAVEWRPGRSRWGRVAGTFAVGAIWNGIVGAFVYHLAEGWSRGRGEWIPSLFMLPFALVGIGIVAFWFHALLQAFNPRVVVTLLSAPQRLGMPLKLAWRIEGGARRLRQLRIRVRASEAATHSSGSGSVTDESVFFERELLQTGQPLAMAAGTVALPIPEDLMFSFDSGNNRVYWEIVIEGAIPNWPDIEDKYRFGMLPPENGGTGS